jgi:hypothetical protein
MPFSTPVNQAIVAYLEAIEGINIADRRLHERDDATARSLLEIALDAAEDAWQLIPADFRSCLEPPPERYELL